MMKVDKTWTLFLDRDGVINEDNVGGYVLTVEEIKLYPGVTDAMKKFAECFGVIVVCTNQRSIGKGLLDEEVLHQMNDKIIAQIQPYGGRIDKIYFSPALYDEAHDRKPNPGMAEQAKRDFPQIDFKKSVMVGNNLTDMGFARNAGIARSVFLTTTVNDLNYPHPLIDEHYGSLKEFSDSITIG